MPAVQSQQGDGLGLSPASPKASFYIFNDSPLNIHLSQSVSFSKLSNISKTFKGWLFVPFLHYKDTQRNKANKKKDNYFITISY